MQALAMDIDVEKCLAKTKTEPGGSSPGLIPSLQNLSPDRIRCISSSLLVHQYDPDFKILFVSQLDKLSRPNSDIELRQAAIDSLGMLGNETMESRLGTYLRDPHSTIRLAAARALVRLFHRGITLSTSLLEPIKECVNDDYEPIRFESVDLIWALSYSEPDSVISYDPFAHSLADVLFLLLCQLSFDSSVKIRTKAIRLLGSIPGTVDMRLILQTFSKVPLSELISGARQSARFQFDSSDVDSLMSQREFLEVCQRQSLPIPDHFAGVFVHGLEDEFASVRQASLDSIYAISLRIEMVALTAFDFLVDLFNDELHQVRIASIQAVFSLMERYSSISFSPDQLMSLLSNLSDCESLMRQETIRLLNIILLPNAFLLQITILALLRCLSLFPEDKELIHAAVRTIGTSHSELARLLIGKWLQYDSNVFDQQSAITSGPVYLAFLLFVHSAGSTDVIGALPSPFKNLLDHCKDLPTSPMLKDGFCSQTWICPNEIIKVVNETFEHWIKHKFSIARSSANRLRSLLFKRSSDGPTQACWQFCELYAEWIWICCTVLSGEYISFSNHQQRANQIAFLLSETFFGLSHDEQSHVALLQKFTSISPRWWPTKLSLTRLQISLRLPRSDPNNPVIVRPQAASIIPVEVDLRNIYQHQRLTIRLQIGSQVQMHDVNPNDLSPGKTPWAFVLKTKIRITRYDLKASEAASTVLFGFVWRDHPAQWLIDPVKVYLQIAS